MTHITENPISKLRKAPQPPLSYPGAVADSDRAKKPRLSKVRLEGKGVVSGNKRMSLAEVAGLSQRTGGGLISHGTGDGATALVEFVIGYRELAGLPGSLTAVLTPPSL